MRLRRPPPADRADLSYTNYIPGHSINLGFSVLVILLVGVQWSLQARENRLRARGGRDYRLEGKAGHDADLLDHLHPAFRSARPLVLS